MPLPYVPSMAAAMRVTSADSDGSAGAASVRDSFRSLSFRAVSGSVFTLSKRVACLAYATEAEIVLSAYWAARVSESSVM